MEQLGPRAHQLFDMFHALVGIVFTIAMTYAGLQIVLLAISTGERSESTLGVPLAIYYAAMPVGMVLMLVSYIKRLVTVTRVIRSSTTQKCPPP